MASKLRIGDLRFEKEERAALQRVIDSGRISEGPEVRAFEEEYADWLGVKHCVAVSSGTAALICGLKALMLDERFGLVNEGSKVLIPALTFIATASAVQLVGLEPVFGDISPVTLCLRPRSIPQENASVIMPVHLMGYAADMDAITKQAETYAVPPVIVEDACEAHGTTHGGKRVGSFSTWSAFSFYIAHTVQAGEFGCVCTDDAKIAELVRRLKAHGRKCACKPCTRNTTGCPFLSEGDPRFTHLFPGYNFKPMEWQAAVARVQLSKVDENLERRWENVCTLNDVLRPAGDKLICPVRIAGTAFMAYPLVLEEGLGGSREAFLADLEAHDVEARPLFGCIPTQQPAFSQYKEQYEGKLPWAEYYGARGFYVGCHQYLSKDDMKRIGAAILDSLERI